MDLLCAALPAQALRSGIEVCDVRPDGTVRHNGGTSTADLVVGADGVHSVTRRSLWPHVPGPRYVGYTTWRFLTSTQPIDGSVETWGRGERFGYMPMPDGRVYCYALANAPIGSRIHLDQLRERFAHWHGLIPALLNAADEGAVSQHDTYELPELPGYVSGRVAVIGDAAHAMAPNLGQGACQALEDAVTLAAAVDTSDVRARLEEYDRVRRPRTQQIARRSRQAGAPAHWTSPSLTTLRDLALPLLPRALFSRSVTDAYTWTL